MSADYQLYTTANGKQVAVITTGEGYADLEYVVGGEVETFRSHVPIGTVNYLRQLEGWRPVR